MLAILLSITTASISFTVTETQIFKPLRDSIKNPFFNKLFSCGYCFSHWIAFILVIIYQPKLFHFFWILDYFLTVLVIAWLASIQWLLMCWIMDKLEK